jgi:hypothetical protein
MPRDGTPGGRTAEPLGIEQTELLAGRSDRFSGQRVRIPPAPRSLSPFRCATTWADVAASGRRVFAPLRGEPG